MVFEREKELLPDYPRTKHLPHQPNASRQDLIATEDEASIIFREPHVYIEEKVDGANLGVMWEDEGPVIRNRSHILRKGYRKETAAKMQFASTWSWMYDRREAFLKLHDLFGPASIYGEWLYAQHSIPYKELPSYFIAFDIFDHQFKKYLDTGQARKLLQEAGFDIPPLLHHGELDSYQHLTRFLEQPSAFSPTKREGVYLKVSDGSFIQHRFKMVRQDFIAGEHWSDSHLMKNGLRPKQS